jgi:nitrogen fixation/metabolism regulation signal transduction histidine kinase
MQGSLRKQPQIKILPVPSINKRLGLREADIDEVMKTVQGVLPQQLDDDIDVTITLLEKNLKIMTDMALMKEALTHLIIYAMPGCGRFPLKINQVHFEIKSLLNGNDSIIGACAFISLAAVGTYICVDEKIKKKILEPFFTTETKGNGLGLAMAYRFVKQHHGIVKVKSRGGTVQRSQHISSTYKVGNSEYDVNPGRVTFASALRSLRRHQTRCFDHSSKHG